MEIINFTYKHVTCFILQSSCGWIMIDAGWPNSLPQLLQLLKQKDIQVSDIKYLMVTHFHPDHAGLVQNLKDLGVNLILHECQVPFVDKMNEFFKRKPIYKFKDIVAENNIVVSSAETRRLLKDVGIDGELIQTPGHSDDSISLIIDKCCAYTGDLPEFSLVEAYNDQTLVDSWNLVHGYDVEKIYPAHGNPYTL